MARRRRAHRSPERSREIGRLSRLQNGAVTTQQLYAIGLTRDAIRARLRRGRLVALHRGVYAVGDPLLLPLVHASAAVLALGPDAVLSHRSAAALYALAEPDPLEIDVTVFGGNRRARSGVRVHRVRQMHRDDIAVRAHLAVTSPARTVIDFASEATSSELSTAFGEARAKHLLDDPRLAAALERLPKNHPGAAIVRAMQRAGGGYDRSKAELLMRRHLGRAGLPQARVNVLCNGCLVDFLWPEAKLIVEVDGYDVHGTRQAFERDRRRDQLHAAAGYTVIRVTWAQLVNEPIALIARIAAALAVRRAA